MQELFDQTADKKMEEALTKAGYTATTKLNRTHTNHHLNGGARTFVKTGHARAKLVETHSYIYKEKIDYLLGADALANKGILQTSVQKNGKTYHIFNTHLQAYYPERDRRHYVEVTLAQCVELRHYIEKQRAAGLIKPGDKVIIGG